MTKAVGNRIVLSVICSMMAACAKAPMPTSMPLSAYPPSHVGYPIASSANTATVSAPKSSVKPTGNAKPTTGKPATTGGTAAAAKAAANKPAAKSVDISSPEAIAELRSGVQALADRTENFVSQVSSWNVGKGEKQACTVNYTWSKANTAIEILQSSNASTVGAKVLWSGGTTAKVRAKVLGIPIKMDLPIADERLANKRGYTFADTSIQVWQRNILDPASQITIRGKQILPNGKEAIVFDCLSSYMMPGITKEIYGLDVQTKAPLLLQMYESETCVYEVQVKDVQFNVTLGPDVFQL